MKPHPRSPDIDAAHPAMCVTCNDLLYDWRTAARHRMHDHLVTDLESGRRIRRMIRVMQMLAPRLAQPRESGGLR